MLLCFTRAVCRVKALLTAGKTKDREDGNRRTEVHSPTSSHSLSPLKTYGANSAPQPPLQLLAGAPPEWLLSMTASCLSPQENEPRTSDMLHLFKNTKINSQRASNKVYCAKDEKNRSVGF